MIFAGVSRYDITPSLSVPHAGWGAQTHIFADGVESELYIAVLVVGDGHTEVVLIDVDAGMFLVEQADELRAEVAKSLGITSEAVRLSVTHTHAGPCFWSRYYADGQQAAEDYFRHLCQQAVLAAKEAQSSQVRVTVSAGTGPCDIGGNRRQKLENGKIVTGFDGSGPTDPTVGVVRLDSIDGEPIATIVHYSCHPTVLGYTYRKHSPDYPGAAKRTVEAVTGGICMFLQGCAGNIGPGPEGFLSDVTAMKRIGAQLGVAAAKVSLNLAGNGREHAFEGVVESGASLGIWKSKTKTGESNLDFANVRIALQLNSIRSLPEVENEYRVSERMLNGLHASGASPDEIGRASFRAKRAFLAWDTARKFSGRTEYEVEVLVIALGNAVLVGCPLELFVETGLTVKANSPFPVTLLSGYSGGHLGYLPIENAYGEGGYEVETSPFAAGSAEFFADELTTLLNRIYKHRNISQII